MPVPLDLRPPLLDRDREVQRAHGAEIERLGLGLDVEPLLGRNTDRDDGFTVLIDGLSAVIAAACGLDHFTPPSVSETYPRDDVESRLLVPDMRPQLHPAHPPLAP